jgi:ribonucleoside-diphosphate reductase alpha chain
MSSGFFDVAKHYIIYRYEHSQARAEKKKEDLKKIEENTLKVTKRDGKKAPFSVEKLKTCYERFVVGFEKDVDIDKVINQVKLEVYDGISTEDVFRALIMVNRSLIEIDPAYSRVATKMLLIKMYKQVFGNTASFDNVADFIKEKFPAHINKMVDSGKFDLRMKDFDLEELASYMKPERDTLFEYMGLEILQSRYLLEDMDNKIPYETPQMFWMRIAMGTALTEAPAKRTQVAKEFYDVLSEFYYTPGGRTLYQSGVIKAQLSNCFLNVVPDDLNSIFKTYSDNAQLLKWSGGVGTSWSKVRATGAHVKSIDIQSQGVVPYLKVANDINVCIMRSGKRRSAACVYLETWHYDIEDFLELRKNTGDERRRTHDISTANWVPDLFMKRVQQEGEWTLFSPDETPELHDLYGKKFDDKYVEYEKLADEGKIKVWKRIKAKDLWKKMLGMLFETGHPWITWKDPCNIRSPQDHVGVVHSSNLCTEITLNTSANETAVCNLGSVNFAKFVKGKEFDRELLQKVMRIAVRMTDNTIDINYYPTEDSRRSNTRHRPIGLGIRGYHDALYDMGINFDTDEAVEFADYSMELMSYYTILASSELAREKGCYESYKGSKWDRGILPQDTIDLLEKERGMIIDLPRGGKLDWTPVRNHIKTYGMRNSNTMAIAPTASTANLVGCIPSIEPIYKNIYVKSNKDGDFVVVNKYLIRDLKKINLWNEEILGKLKFHDGSVQDIKEIPQVLKDKYKEVFEINQRWLILSAARRSKWIDQSQSLNIFFKDISGKELSDIYMYAWGLGLKTTYYLRTLGASQVEKSTVSTAEFGSTHVRGGVKSEDIIPSIISDIPSMQMSSTATVAVAEEVDTETAPIVYNIFRADSVEECESCSA